MTIDKRLALRGLAATGVAAALALAGARRVRAQPGRPFRIGFIAPLTGASSSIGRQQEAGARLWLAQSGGAVAGRPVELLVKDDGGVADQTRRIAQELVVNEKVDVLAGFGLTPLALATAPLATQSRTPMVVTSAAASAITEASPYIVRTSFTLPQVTVPLAGWAAAQGIRRAMTLVTDYAPGIDAEKSFRDAFTRHGGQVAGEIRAPLRNPDFAPFLQRVRDARPEALFVFLPSGQGAAFMRQFAERGLAGAGIRLIATGDVTDDDQLDAMGDAALGVVNSHHYSAAHPSPANRRFVEAFQAMHRFRPNFMAVGAYDGMRLIARALEATRGEGGGDALLAAMKGQAFESPRGPVRIDAQTRDIVQDVYMRRVERRDGQLWNVEFDVHQAVKDPGKPR